MRLQSRAWLGGLVVMGFMSASAGAQLIEDFDSCAVGNITVGPANPACHNWQQWDSAPNTTSFINTDVSRSAPNSVSVDSIVGGGTSDLVHTFSTPASGVYQMRAFQYLPGAGATPPLIPSHDKIYFIVMNTYADFGPYDWSVQLTMDPTTAAWTIDAGSPATATGPITFDAWVEVRANIDLTNDLCEVFYNGASCAPPYTWTGGVFGQGGGALNVAAVDLYHGPATATPSGKGYWDDFKFDGATNYAASYCTGKLNAGTGASPGGCVPQISAAGTASATSGAGFFVSANGVLTGKSVLLFYTNTGTNHTPFLGGTLCVGPAGIRRTGVKVAIPASGPCASGTAVLDMNAFAQSAGPPVPPAYLKTAGTNVFCQWWGRDQGYAAPNNVQLSDALGYLIGP